MEYKLNKYQTQLDEKFLNSLPKTVKAQLIDYIENVPFIKWLIQPEEIRGYVRNKTRYVFPNEEDPEDLVEDPNGRIRVDLTKPHILEDMDFFRERALFFMKHKKYTNITPNANPKSAYAEFWREELRRWKDGYTRPSDGEWIPGGLYFYWNYSPIWIVEDENQSSGKAGKRNRGRRKREFPKPYLGDYLFYHYMQKAMDIGMHGKGLKTRGIGASFKFGSLSPRNMYVYPGSGNPNFHLASDKTYLKGDKGIWGKIIDCLDWIAENTPLPRLRLVDKKEGMEIQLGYMDKFGTRQGLLSSAFGISVKDDPDKARGIRGPLIHYEEDGAYPNLESNWNINLAATQEGDTSFGFMMGFGTGGTVGADFEGSEKLFYNPAAYNIYGIPNVFDLNSSGDSKCGFFWGSYLNRRGCYNMETGEPDVIKALIAVLLGWDKIRKNSTDARALTQRRAEECITPQDAVMRIEGTVFPVADLKDYLAQVMPNLTKFIKGHYYGTLHINLEGNVEWKISESAKDKVIREFPITDNKNKEGAIEIFQMPIKINNRVDRFRYIAGIDPIDDDHSTTNSLGSIFILDRYQDIIVAEYTGRPATANQFYEICYRMLRFYGAVANYENDKKGLYSYFSQKNALHLLCDNPEILSEKSLSNIKENYGNKKKGTNSSKNINQWGRRLQADWLVKPAYGEIDPETGEHNGLMNLHKVRSVGYVKELIAWHPDQNADRVSAMGMLMILYEEVARYEYRSAKKEVRSRLHEDSFFKRHSYSHMN